MSSLKVAVIADGHPFSPQTNSGVAAGLCAGLEADERVHRVVPVDGKLGIIGRAIARTLSFRWSKSHWDQEYLWGWQRIAVRSLKRDLALLFRDIDLVVHVRNIYSPCRRAYVAFIDTTVDLRQSGWPERALPDPAYARRIAKEQRYFENASAVTTAADYVAAHLRTRIASGPRIAAVGAGAPFRPVNVPKSVRSGALRVLFVGKEFARKGGPELLAAVSKLRDSGVQVEVDILGPEARSNSEGVHWHGFVKDREALAAFYTRADVFCLPAHFEPFGLVVLEALAHGLPCLVSDVGVLPELVGHEQGGLVVPSRDVGALTRGLERIARDDALRLSLAQSAASRVVDYSWANVGSRIIDAAGTQEVAT